MAVPFGAELPNFAQGLHLQLPSVPTVFFFLLSNPFVTLSLAIFLYVTIPRIWRAFVKYIVVPTAVVGTGLVVLRNPESVRSAGTFITHCKSSQLALCFQTLLNTNSHWGDWACREAIVGSSNSKVCSACTAANLLPERQGAYGSCRRADVLAWSFDLWVAASFGS